MFSRFMDDPSQVDDILAQVAADAEQAFHGISAVSCGRAAGRYSPGGPFTCPP